MRYIDAQFYRDHPELQGVRPYLLGGGLAASGMGGLLYGAKIRPLYAQKSTMYLLGGLGLMALAANRLLAASRRVQAAARIYDFDFVRNSLAYTADGKIANLNVPRFEPGKFDQAIKVEEGTTNLLKNASFEYDSNGDGKADGWNTWIRDTASTSISWSLDGTRTCGGGSYSQKAVIALNNYSSPYPEVGGITQAFSIGENQPVSRFVYAYTDNPDFAVLCRLQFHNASGSIISVHDTIMPYDIANQWYKVIASTTTPAGTATASFQVFYRSRVPTTQGTIWLDTAQCENKTYSTSPIFAADAVTQATRASEVPTIPTAGVLNPQEGTVECWINISANTWDTQIIFDSRNTALSDLNLYNVVLYIPKYTLPTARKLAIQCGDGVNIYTAYDSVQLDLNTWYYVVMRWTANKLELLKNGQVVATINANIAWNLPSQATIGCRTSLTGQLNGLIDDLRISSIARSDAEIAAAYQSGQPLPVDQYTTKKLSFDFPVAA